MALKIRLSRVGTKNEPHFRVVVAEERSRRDGDAVEQIGSYNPRAKGNTLTIKLDRVDYWVSKGAKPTATMHSMIKRAKRAVPAAAATA
jgi:small subunit ribosomal protein S16